MIPVQKSCRSIDPSIKSFIKSVMAEEKLYGTKFLDKKYVRKIRTSRNDDGSKMFQPDQYLQVSKVS